jgi:hypothetical protein
MSYPPPPGISSLPARPPASTNSRPGFKSAFGAAPRPAAQQPAQSYTAAAPATSYAAPSTQYGASYGSYGSGGNNVGSSAAPGMNSAPVYGAYAQPQPSQPAQSFGPQSYGPQSFAAPQIQNPFPLPGTSAPANDYDPEMAAQIAQWQSAYVSKDVNSTATTTRDGRPVAGAEYPRPEVASTANSSDKKKTVVREGGGKKWTDDTLMDWDPAHPRLFVGNLAGETTDESLLKAFSRWKSVQKARVIRDKRTTKSKGFGFVAFSDTDDFFQAAKEMNGKYIQSHPVTIRKATTEIKVTNVKEKDRGRKNKNHKNNHKGDRNAHYEPNQGPIGGGGVTKPGQKMKNGLKLLG